MNTHLPVTIDRTSSVPLYRQLAGQLSAAIDSGLIQPGDTFENELSLAQRLDLSRPTVRRAIAELVQRGLLVRRRGAGTTVANKAIHRKAELSSLHDDLVRRGKAPTTRVVQFETEVSNARASEKLGLLANAPLVFVERLRSIDGIPLAILRNWLPAPIPKLTVQRLAEGSLYRVLREEGILPVIGNQRIGARRPTLHECQLLDLKPGDPLLTMSRVAFDARGKPVEYGDHCYRYDQYFFDIVVHEH